VRVSVKREAEAVRGTVTVRPRAWNLGVLALSAVLLAVIPFYVAVENLHQAG
jgi:hypothetical protein